MTAAPRLAVIIPHYDDPFRLAKCLAALAPQLAAAPRAECVVADNGSPCDLGPLRTAHPGIRFLDVPEKGAAAARNGGVAATTAPGLLFLDSDCVPGPGWLAAAMALLAAFPEKGAVAGGRIGTFDETPPPRSGAEAFETVFAFRQRDYVARKGFSVTANLLTTRRVFEDVGPLIVGLSEDVDWCRRAVAKGYSLRYADGLEVAHPTRSDWAALRRKWHRTTSEGFQLNGTSAPARARWALRALAVAASGPAHLPQVLRAERLSGIEKRRAAATLLRLRLVRAGWMLGQALRG
ncbi:glycosyltransferase family 2 protein [Poseidonocella sp. HB161398]|uniref:glycosyltransferase family 2 protein n=1 Tax=Poseidonocella sp. HB161398 TaxID=2320855 RepID=UPI001109E66F|nr:glycosyltransferase [Poseidonocella sp. HB161398]